MRPGEERRVRALGHGAGDGLVQVLGGARGVELPVRHAHELGDLARVNRGLGELGLRLGLGLGLGDDVGLGDGLGVVVVDHRDAHGRGVSVDLADDGGVLKDERVAGDLAGGEGVDVGAPGCGAGGGGGSHEGFHIWVARRLVLRSVGRMSVQRGHGPGAAAHLGRCTPGCGHPARRSSDSTRLPSRAVSYRVRYGRGGTLS